MQEERLTIQDIARMAGVAKSTVSRYLNGGKISEQTKYKIREIIETHQYEPNAFAQSLKAKKSKFIGIIAPCLDSVSTSRVIMAIDERLKKSEYNTLIVNTSHDQQREIQSLQGLIRLKVDGIILVATQLTAAHKKLMKALNIPIVLVGQRLEGITCVINDDSGAGQCLGEYICSKGHQQVLYIGVGEEDEAVGKIRKEGILKGLGQGNIQVTELITDFSMGHAEQLMKTQLEKLEKITAIICATDNIALGVLKVLNQQKKRVPEQIALAGFGGYEVSRVITPTLTTIRFHHEQAGEKVAETIIKLIEGEEVKAVQKVGFDLIEGEST